VRAVRRRFPGTRPARLALLPSRHLNQAGSRPITEDNLIGRHRIWLNTMGPLRRADRTDYDRADRCAGRRGAPRSGYGGPGPGRARAAAKMADLSMALEGRFTNHHALMCRLHLVTPRTLRCWQS
jgi:hypothetical protein